MGARKDRKKQMDKIRETLSAAQQKGIIDANGHVKVDTLADRRTAEIMARKPDQPKHLVQGSLETDGEFSNRKAAVDKAYREWERDVSENQRRIKEENENEVPVFIQQFRRATNRNPITGERIVIDHISSTESDEDA